MRKESLSFSDLPVSAPRYKRGGKWVRTSGVSVKEKDDHIVKNEENIAALE